ncbi:MAG: type II secretion system protein GspM [Limnohabitans sp.]
MQAWVNKLKDRLQALSPRERVMAVVALLAALVYVGDAVLISPQQHRAQVLQDQLALESKQLQQLQQAVETIRASRSPQALAVERLRRDELKSEVLYAQDVIDRAQSSLRAGGVARMVIAQSQGLTLRTLNVGVPQVFHAPKPPGAAAVRPAAAAASAPAAAAAEALPTLYMHEVTFSVDGTYDQLSRFLRRLEAQPERLFWPEVVLTVKQYPQVNLRATLHTLSVHQDAPLE